MANLEKVIYINEVDYSTLVNGGSITKSGVTYTYDETALYVIKDVGAPEYAETAGYATSAGTATKATQDGSGNAITETYATKASGASEILYTDENSSEYNVTVGDTLNEVITALDDAIGEFHVTVDSALSETSENAISNKAITQALYEDEEVISASLNDLNERMEEKQDLLVSGSNIKTINNQSLLGSGNINISGGGGGDVNVIEIVKVNGTALTPDSNKAVDVTVPTALSALSTDTTHQLVTSTEKSNWNSHTGNTEVHVTSSDKSTWSGKQDALVSGTNIKTINTNSLLGSGDITIPTGETNVIETIKVNGTAQTVTNKTVDLAIPMPDSGMSTTSENPVQNKVVTQTILDNELVTSTALNELNARVDDKQDELVSGINLKTINNNSLLGSGNLTISTGETNVIETVKVNGTALTPDSNKAVDVTVPTALSALSTDTTHQLVTSTEKSNWNSHTGNTEVHVTSTDKSNWNTHTADTSVHVTSTDKTNWDGKVSKTGDTMTGSLTISNADLSVTGTTRLTYNNATALVVGSTGVCATGLTQISGDTTIKGNLMTTGKTEFRYSGDTILGLGSTGVCVTGRTYVSGDTEFKGGVSVIYSGNTALSVNGNASFTGQTKLNRGSNAFEFNSGDTAVKITGNTATTGQTKLYSSGNTLLVTGGTQINGGLTASTFSGNSVTAERIYRYGHTSVKEVLFSDGESSPNITLSQLPAVSATDNGKILMVVNGAWALVSPTTIYTGTGTPSSSQGNNGDIYLQTT